MTLYISSKNQTMIWENIQRTDLFQNVWKNVPEEVKMAWFQKIIGFFYAAIKNKKFTVQELRQLNKDTILFMIDDLKKRSNLYPATYSLSNPNQNVYSEYTKTPVSAPITAHANTTKLQDFSIFDQLSLMEDKSVTRGFILEQKQEEMNRKFLNRQTEYATMLKQNVQPEIDFRISLENDGPIKDMDSLIQQHIDNYEIYQAPVTASSPMNVPPNKSVHWEDQTDFMEVIKTMKMTIERMQNEICQLKTTGDNVELARI